MDKFKMPPPVGYLIKESQSKQTTPNLSGPKSSKSPTKSVHKDADKDEKYVEQLQDTIEKSNVVALTGTNNGVRIYWLPLESEVLTLRFTVLLGFQNEGEQSIAEFCHANEHMAAKFTSKKYKDGSSVTEQLQKLGVQSNASTSISETSYYMTGPSVNQSKMVDIFMNSIFDPVYDKKLFESEMMSVENELQSIISDTWYTYNNAEAKILYPGTPLGRTEEDRIKNIQRLRESKSGARELMEWRKKTYHPSRCCFFIHGKLDYDELNKIVQGLKKLKPTSSVVPCPTADAIANRAVVTVPKIPSGNQHRMTVLYQLPFDGRQFGLKSAVSCAVSALGGGLGSRLYQSLRKGTGIKGKRGAGGLAYAVICATTFHPCGNLPSFFYVDVKFQTHRMFKTPYATAAEVLRRIKDVLRKFAKTGPTEAEMTTWRAKLKVEKEYVNYYNFLHRAPALADDYWDFVRPQLLYADLDKSLQDFTGCQPKVSDETADLLKRMNMTSNVSGIITPKIYNTHLSSVTASQCQTVMAKILQSNPIIVKTDTGNHVRGAA